MTSYFFLVGLVSITRDKHISEKLHALNTLDFLVVGKPFVSKPIVFIALCPVPYYTSYDDIHVPSPPQFHFRPTKKLT